jgi:all-trans-8'-apo-beta-carotenal 15,15'-oxygenase
MFGSNATHPARMGARTSSWWSDLRREHGYEALRQEGRMPEVLDGTLYRTGPALTQRFGSPYHHVFEGDGAISAMRIKDGGTQGAVRLLRGEGFVAEERAGRPLFYSAAPKLRQLTNNLLRRSKNTGNTNVMRWHDTLYGLMENATPLAFDADLETIGESTLGGVIRGTFSAHPHEVPERRAAYNFGMSYGRETKLSLYELPAEGPARVLTEMPLEHPVMLHDFMATRDHLVLLVSPYRLVLHRAILGLGGLDDLFRWVPEAGTEVIVVPIDQPERVRRFKTDAFFQIHLAGGWDEPDAVVVDVAAYPDASALQRNVAEVDRPPEAGVLTRIRIPHQSEQISKEPLCDTRIEFGSVDPRWRGRRYGQVFGLTVDETRFGVARIDTERSKEHVYWFPEDEFAGEPVFVPDGPDAGDGEGYLLLQVYSVPSHTTHLAVIDARAVENGPIARAHFDHHIPAGFHGIWVPAEA